MRLSLPPVAFLLLISSHPSFAFNASPNDLPHGEKSDLRPLGHTAQPGTWRASIPFGIPPPPPDEPFIPRGPPLHHNDNMFLDPRMMGPPHPLPMHPPFLGHHPPHPGMMGPPPNAFLNEPLHPNEARGPHGGGMPLDGIDGPPPPLGPFPGMMGPVYDEVVDHPMQGPGPGFWQHKFDDLRDAGPGTAPFQVPRDSIDNAPQSEQRPHRPMEEPNNNKNNNNNASNGPSSSRSNTNPARSEHPNDPAPPRGGGGNAKGRSSIIDPNDMNLKMSRNDQEQIPGGNRPPSTGQGGHPNNQGMNNRNNPQMNRWPYNMQTPSGQQQRKGNSNNNNHSNDPNAHVPMEDPNGKTGGSVGPSHHRHQRPQPYSNHNVVEPRYRNGGGGPTMPMAGPNSNAGRNMGEDFHPRRPRPPPPPGPVQYKRNNGGGGDPNEHVPMADPNGGGSANSNGPSLGGGIQNRNDDFFLPMMERYNDYDDRYNHPPPPAHQYQDDPMMMMDGMEAYRASEYDNFNLHPPMEDYDPFMHHFNTNEQHPPLPPPPPAAEFYEGNPLSQSPLLPPRPPPSHFEREEWYDGPNTDPRMMRLDDNIDGYLDYY